MLFMDASIATANAASSDSFVTFVGASETAGYGLRAGEQAYPAILQQRCGFVARVDGEVNKPVLFRPMLSPPGSTIVYFVSQFDAYLQPTSDSIKEWLMGARRRKMILVEAPLLPDAAGILALYQRRFYRELEQAASQTGVTVVLLSFPEDVESYVQADSLHPNERGEIFIADTLEPRLKTMHLCQKEAGSQSEVKRPAASIG
jgi:lysophospholipase L1-like esterase